MDVTCNWWPGESAAAGKFDLMVFGEGEDPDDEMLHEITTVRLTIQDARQFAQLLLDAAARMENMPGSGRAWGHFRPGGEALNLN